MEDTPKKKGKKNIWILPSIVFIILMSVSFFIYKSVQNLAVEEIELEFSTQIEQINVAIANRLDIYTNVLLSGRGLFDASNEVSRDEWKAYVNSLGVAGNYPGIQGIGYSEWVPADKKIEHEARVQSEGFPDYTIRPEGIRDEYTAIVYLEPFDERNKQAFGFDMFQEFTRNKAMSQARDSGNAALSGKVTLVQEIDSDVQAGFLVYVPTYAKNSTLLNSTDRKNALAGYVYSPFRMNNFMKGILTSQHENLVIEVFDGVNVEDLTEDRRMYGKRPSNVAFKSIQTIEHGGHGWTIRYSALDNYGDRSLRSFTALIFLIAGSILSVLIFILIYTLNTRRNSAQALANSMTDDLRLRTEETEEIRKQLEITNKELEHKASILSEKIEELEQTNNIMLDREMKMIELKKNIKKDTDTDED